MLHTPPLTITIYPHPCLSSVAFIQATPLLSMGESSTQGLLNGLHGARGTQLLFPICKGWGSRGKQIRRQARHRGHPPVHHTASKR